MSIDDLRPGDIAAVRTPAHDGFWSHLAGRLIRLGAALQDQPNLVNHIVIVSHRDAAGTLWGIEGRPGGVGWVDVAEYDDRYLISNAQEVKTDEQRAIVVDLCRNLLGTSYDWGAIVIDTARALTLADVWGMRREEWGPGSPAHVVCSSLADLANQRAGLKHPGDGRLTTPAEWYDLFLSNGWR